jgi:hypothetical protein
LKPAEAKYPALAIREVVLQKKIRPVQIQSEFVQRDLDVGCCIAVEIGLDDDVATGLEPSHAVGNDI